MSDSLLGTKPNSKWATNAGAEVVDQTARCRCRPKCRLLYWPWRLRNSTAMLIMILTPVGLLCGGYGAVFEAGCSAAVDLRTRWWRASPPEICWMRVAVPTGCWNALLQTPWSDAFCSAAASPARTTTALRCVIINTQQNSVSWCPISIIINHLRNEYFFQSWNL